MSDHVEPPDEPPMCEECYSPTTRLCKRCGQRICRVCATDHQVHNYENPGELQNVGKCVPTRASRSKTTPDQRGRKRQFTQAEIDHMRELFNDPSRNLSAAAVGRLMRCSYTTVLRAVDGKMKAKDGTPQAVALAGWKTLIATVDARVRRRAKGES